MKDVCRFIIAFRVPLSISAPHTYISAGPFLPSASGLSRTISAGLTKTIKMQRGKLLSWPAPPLEWIGHSGPVICLSYSPNGRHVVSGSYDNTIRIWDTKTGVAVGEPLTGHIQSVRSVAYSPDGRHIVSGSADNAIRIWDAKTGGAVGEPLKGHAKSVSSVAYSPDGRHIVSGSEDNTIRIWDAETGAAVHEPLKGHTEGVSFAAYSPDGRHIISRS